MNNLQQYPQKIDNWDLGIDYVMFIDEKAFDLLLERYIYATKNNKKGIKIFP